MADDVIQVKIGADASGLVGGTNTAKAALQGLSKEFELLRRTVADAAAFQVNELGSSLKELQANLTNVGPAAQRAAREMKAFHEAAAGGHGGGAHGSGRLLFEVHALFDELSSGRSHQAIGTFSNLLYILSGINPMFAAAAAGAVGLGIAVYETAKHFLDLKKTAEETRQAIAFSGNYGIVDPKAVDSAAEQLRKLKGVFTGISEEDVNKFSQAFAQMGSASNETIQGMALAMATMWKQFGDDEKEASKNIVEMFARPLAPISEIEKRLHGLTPLEKERLKAAQDTNSPIQAQAALVAILADRERQANAEKRAALQTQIADLKTYQQELNSYGRDLTEEQRGVLKALQDQVDAIDKIGRGLDDMAGKMRSAVEPAQNVGNAMREWSRAANPQAKEMDDLDAQIARGKAQLAKLRGDAAASPAGASVFGGLVSSGEIGKAEAGLDTLIDKRRKLAEEMSGTNPRLKAEIANLRDENSGRANSVTEAQRILDAAKENLNSQTQAKFKGPESEAYKAFEQAEKELDDKKRSLAESEAALEVALTGKNFQTRYASEVKLSEIRRQAANGDPTKLNEVAAERARIDQAYREHNRANADEDVSEEMARLKENTQERLANYASDVRNHRLSAQQGAEAAQNALRDEMASLRQFYEQKRRLAGEYLDQLRNLKRQEATDALGIEKQIAAQQREAADALIKQWQNTADTISGALNSQVSGLLRSTTSWSQAGKNIVADFVTQSIQGFVKLGANFVLQQSVMNTAATTGAALRLAAEQTASSGGIAALIAKSITAITVDAGVAGAGATAQAAPYLGPAAPAVGAGVAAQTLAFASFDIGAWNLPQDQLAMVHKNELVMPAAEAGAFRNLLSAHANGGGVGGGNVSITPTTHFVVNAIDGASASQWMRDNQHSLMRAIDEGMRHGAHLGLRRLATV